MSEIWEKGLPYLRNGHPYAAIETWEPALETAEGQGLAQLLNGLGVALDRVRGPEHAKTYFERAVAVLDGQDCSDLHLLCSANLAAVLGRLNQTDQALEIIRQYAPVPNARPPQNALNSVSVQTYVLLKRELYTELTETVDQWTAALAGDLAGFNLHMRSRWGTALHNCASAYVSLGQMEQALAFYRQSQQVDETIQTTRELAWMQLLRGSVHEALAVSRDIYDGFWQFTITSEKSSIARSIELIGTFAFYAGQTDLFHRCTQKAEVYFGQNYQWGDWLRMRDLETELAQYRVDVDPDALDWTSWHNLLDGLNLIDGMEAMFPNLYHVAQMTATYAARLYERMRPDDPFGKRTLQVAGRMIYLGLTIQAASEAEAQEILQREGSREETAQLGARLLDAYPNSAPLGSLVRDAWPNAESSRELPLASACLRLAVRYVERVMLDGLVHSRAIVDVETRPPAGIEPSTVKAFLSLFAL